MSNLKKITIDRLSKLIKKLDKKWSELKEREDATKFIQNFISRITITNEVVSAYINYDKLSNQLVNFDIEIANIERDKLMKIWRNR